MPEHAEQKQMNRNERCGEQEKQRASRQEAVVLRHEFVPFVRTSLATGGASART